MVKIAKFGGSSLADAGQFKKVKEIIFSDPSRRYIVVSAPGKRYSEDSKVTDLLYLCKAHIDHKVSYDQIMQVICDRFKIIAVNLELKIDIDKHFEEIKEEVAKGNTSADYLASRGEYISGLIMAEYLGFQFVDTADYVKFSAKGKFLEEETNKALSEILGSCENAVVPGFYGARPDGSIKTFSRGGSDVTGSLVAKACKADVYENWTDVSGFLMADPRIVPGASPIKNITYKELRELSYMGASVLHEDAVFPVREVEIPINIRNTNEPDHLGTVIVSDYIPDANRIITGIAGKKGFSVIAMSRRGLSEEVGFYKRMLAILEEYNISLEHMPTGIDTVSLVISDKNIAGRMDELVEDFHKMLEPDSIEVFTDMALIATVGCGMNRRRGVSAKLFTALSEGEVNIRMIDQGSSEINIIVGVENDDFENAIRAIYNAFIRKD